MLRTLTAAAVRKCADRLARTRLGALFGDPMVAAALGRTLAVQHRGTELVFVAPNALNRTRVRTFATKEPETLEWIDSIPPESILWDIGANVGLYSCYAARSRACKVYAFEPSVFNLELLARNIFLNGLSDRVTILSLPLFERVTTSTLNMTTVEWGGALSSFDASYGFDGNALRKVFEFRTVSLSLDDCVRHLRLPMPQYIKMDVDGIEHVILRGGREVLQHVKSMSIEINDAFEAQARDCRQLLEQAGLRFVSKRHSEMIEDNATFGRTYNQVWTR